MAKQSGSQKKTVERVMHEFKHGELKTQGGPVKSRKQAIAIALHESGGSNQETPAENRQNLRHTKAKERKGQTGQAEAESAGGASGPTRAALYEQARRRKIPGRSTMSKAQLQRALG